MLDHPVYVMSKFEIGKIWIIFSITVKAKKTFFEKAKKFGTVGKNEEHYEEWEEK